MSQQRIVLPFSHFFLHFHENNDLKVPERSKNGPKKVPILSQRPKFCLCSDFSRQVPNPKSYIGAPDQDVLTKPVQMTDIIVDQMFQLCLVWDALNEVDEDAIDLLIEKVVK